MKTSLKIFNDLIKQAKLSDSIFTYFQTHEVPLDFSDLLRWQWVLAVSALDKYIHDIVRIGMVDAFEGRRIQTLKFLEFKINMSGYIGMNNSSAPAVMFEREIVRQHSFLAFQSPDKISDALSYIWDEKNKWATITHSMTSISDTNDVKVKLNNIVTRRNQIVHQGDCLTTILPLEQQQILAIDVQDVLSFVTELANAIHICVV